MFVLWEWLNSSSMETAAPRADSLEIVEAKWVHQQLYLVFNHRVKGAVEKFLGCALLHVNDLFNHHWHFLLVDFLLVLGGIRIKVTEDRDCDGVHVGL